MSFVTVRVWVSRLKMHSPGHASLALFPQSITPSTGYISFAPEKSGSVNGKGKFYDYQHDFENYNNSSDTGARGCWIGTIYGLDINKMWKEFSKHLSNPPWYSIRNECATQVHHYLELGGGDQFASRWSRNAIGFWSPDDVEDYAKSIIKNTIHLGSKEQKVVGAGTIF